MKKFRTSFNGSITEHEILKETPKQIIYLYPAGHERKELKVTEWHQWFDTKEEAKSYLIDNCIKKIKQLNEQLNYAGEMLAKLKSL